MARLQTLLEALKSVNAYPVPLRTIDEIAARRDIALTMEATVEELQRKEYNLAKADLLLWLSLAPNVSQGGQSYSFSADDRKQLKSAAYAIYDKYGDGSEGKPKSTFGYKGSRL